MSYQFLNERVELKTGDITKEEADAIVNAANSSLMGGGGVDGAIHRAGGSAILDECRMIRNKQGSLATGKAVITTAGNLKVNYVIHTVGPVWNGGSNNEEQLLEDAYFNSLTLCTENKIKVVAFPAISTGVYHFPKDKAAEISSKVIRSYLEKDSSIELVKLIFFKPEDRDIYIKYQKFE